MRPAKQHRLREEDVALFREAVREVTPLRAAPRIRRRPEPPPPVPVQSLLDEHEAFAQACAAEQLTEALIDGLEDSGFARPGIGPDVLRRLRRGRWVVQDELDLHGATRDSARELLGVFLRRATARGARCVRVIHGKGLGSPRREPVLKGLARKFLAQHPQVLAYCEAPAAQGGSGAVLVLLR
jgi:DNA-nicking Smr family endonuclease